MFFHDALYEFRIRNSSLHLFIHKSCDIIGRTTPGDLSVPREWIISESSHESRRNIRGENKGRGVGMQGRE